MPCIAVGKSTGKVYARGTKTDCLRTLQAKYPYHENTQGNRKGVKLPTSTILPEVIIIVRK